VIIACPRPQALFSRDPVDQPAGRPQGPPQLVQHREVPALRDQPGVSQGVRGGHAAESLGPGGEHGRCGELRIRLADPGDVDRDSRGIQVYPRGGRRAEHRAERPVQQADQAAVQRVDRQPVPAFRPPVEGHRADAVGAGVEHRDQVRQDGR
jgi:hypothetical protein